jgi:hypothetical protein
MESQGSNDHRETRAGGPRTAEAYTIAQVTVLTGFSRQTVARLFESEPGVLIVSRPETMHKRRYRSIRIPSVVYERVLRRLKVT